MAICIVDEVRRIISVGGAEFLEKEIDVLNGKELDRAVMNLVISAKRELGGRAIK